MQRSAFSDRGSRPLHLFGRPQCPTWRLPTRYRSGTRYVHASSPFHRVTRRVHGCSRRVLHCHTRPVCTSAISATRSFPRRTRWSTPRASIDRGTPSKVGAPHQLRSWPIGSPR
ncbi:hypothetical protein IEO21_05348 [Rhodonia placenta]|uniref:Uncharacterized protein n=1 Tax=Rhodonia placenta TaxID=104341 RepID=A0A8H7P2J7_9APHY|nr:hypothetical protein IEO21_05348 [Postia placenta]